MNKVVCIQKKQTAQERQLAFLNRMKFMSALLALVSFATAAGFAVAGVSPVLLSLAALAWTGVIVTMVVAIAAHH